MHNLVDEDIQQLVDNLHLSYNQILSRFTFTMEGRPLSEEEAIEFIRYLKSELSGQCTH